MWILNLSLAHKVIKEFSVKDIRSTEWLNSQPFAAGRRISVDKLTKNLIAPFIGCLRLSKVKISKFLDKESRLRAVSAILVLVNLKHWPEYNRENIKQYVKVHWKYLVLKVIQRSSELKMR